MPVDELPAGMMLPVELATLACDALALTLTTPDAPLPVAVLALVPPAPVAADDWLPLADALAPSGKDVNASPHAAAPTAPTASHPARRRAARFENKRIARGYAP